VLDHQRFLSAVRVSGRVHQAVGPGRWVSAGQQGWATAVWDHCLGADWPLDGVHSCVVHVCGFGHGFGWLCVCGVVGVGVCICACVCMLCSKTE